MIKTIFFLAVLFTPFAVNIRLQGQDTAFFSLDEAVSYGLKNITSVKNAENEIKYRQWQTRAAGSAWLPQVTSSADYRYNINLPVTVLPGDAFGQPSNTPLEIQMGTKNAIQAGIQVQQALFNPSAISDVETARVNERIAGNQLAQTRKNAALNIKAAYYDVMINHEKYKLSKSNLGLYRTLADISRNLHQNQLTDSLSANEWINKYQNQLDQVRIDSLSWLNAVKNLKLVINYPMEKPLTITDTSVTGMTSVSIMNGYNTDDLPRYKSVALELSLNKARQQEVQRGYLPALNAYGFVGSQYYDDSFDPFNNSLRWHKQTYVGLRVELPLFDGLRKNRQNAAFKIQEENLVRKKEDLKSEIDTKAGIQQNKITIALKQAVIKQSELNLSRALFNKTVRNFGNGLADKKDVSNAELDLNMKELAYINTLYNLLQARLQYEELVWPGEKDSK